MKSVSPLIRLLPLSALLLSGCADLAGIQPHARLQDANRLERGATLAHSRADLAWPRLDWWQAFGDSQLDALAQRAVADNPTLRMAQARLALAQAEAGNAAAASRPVVNADVSLSRERFTALQFIPPPWGGNYDWNNRAALSMAYDLDLWGRQEDVWHGAIDRSQAAAAEAQQVRLELVTAVVRSYLELALQYNLRQNAQTRLADLQRRAAIAKRARAAGIGTGEDVEAAETALPLAQARLEGFDARIAVLKHQLAALTGQGPGGGDTIQAPAVHLNAPIGLPGSLPADLIGRRPDVRASRWRVEAAGEQIKAARKAFYPNINLLAFVGYQALGFSQFISNAASMGGVGPALSLPLFDGGRRRSTLEASTSGYDMAAENYNAVVLHALQDVSDQLQLLQSHNRQCHEAEQAVQSAEHTYQLAQTSYRAGLSNYQHVLDASTVLLQQKDTLAQLQTARMDAYAGLMRALGGGLSAPDTALANVEKAE